MEETTYTLSLASANIIRQPLHISRVTHKDGRLDRIQRSSSQRNCGIRDTSTAIATTTDGIVHDLPTLAVADQHNLGVGTSLVERVHSRGDGGRALVGRGAVGDAAARGLPAAGWVGDRLGGGAGVGLEDEVDHCGGGAVAGGDGRLAGAEDVHAWAGGLPGLDVEGGGGGEGGPGGEEEEGGFGGGPHDDGWVGWAWEKGIWYG